MLRRPPNADWYQPASRLSSLGAFGAKASFEARRRSADHRHGCFSFLILQQSWTGSQAMPSRESTSDVAWDTSRQSHGEFVVAPAAMPVVALTAQGGPSTIVRESCLDLSVGHGGDCLVSWSTIKKIFRRRAEDCGRPELSPDTNRHFVATMVRRRNPPVPKEQRDAWLGHDEKRTANSYESFDPEYLTVCTQATESIISQLQGHTKRRLSSWKERAKPGLRLVSGGAA